MPADPFEALLARLQEQAVPFSAMWEMTHLCNLACQQAQARYEQLHLGQQAAQTPFQARLATH